ncbi:type III-B CRISPR module RAMP protein Cmr1 [Thermus sp.]|uniref:type III-B CRISPR module RAMP protein Cmr1 n=1 Tax=Thermus sp. TaxID=275 RepID=UPI00321FCA60
MEHKEWKLKALTDIWTGDEERRGDRLVPTGLMGSLRWWFEVLVRGLGGKACDPTLDGVRCPDANKNPPDPGHHCVVCELFGCTGWARKFRLMVVNENGQIIHGQIKAGQTFILRFIPLRPIAPEEWCLLDATLCLIANCGAIGGKTVFKPSDQPYRKDKFHHQDFGLVRIEGRPDQPRCTREHLKTYIHDSRWRRDFMDESFSWASLTNFWCVKERYLARKDDHTSSYNFVIGRPEPKSQSSQGDSWLAGRRARGQPNPQEPESKKVFSFKEPESARRTFGFVRNQQEFSSILHRLLTLKNGGGNNRPSDPVWRSFDPDDPERGFLKGEKILEQLFRCTEREG